MHYRAANSATRLPRRQLCRQSMRVLQPFYSLRSIPSCTIFQSGLISQSRSTCLTRRSNAKSISFSVENRLMPNRSDVDVHALPDDTTMFLMAMRSNSPSTTGGREDGRVRARPHVSSPKKMASSWIRSLLRMYKAPTPLGPYTLCPLRFIISTFISFTSWAPFPASARRPIEKNTLFFQHISPIACIGCSVPISLFTAITEMPPRAHSDPPAPWSLRTPPAPAPGTSPARTCARSAW
mmetsp:Transcript_37345/g.73233  ORF Transcript_37345/g.73233 Transcript_37345/m.73233 type:complete len:238 (-) Transcript_37345:621-1334(-)